MARAANWANRTLWTGDNLPIMRGMNSASVDLIYLDPPFNSHANYAARAGSAAAGAEFKDTWTAADVDPDWADAIAEREPRLHRVIQAAMNPSDKFYLLYMSVRLLELARLLAPNGSIYLHCDQKMSHYLKLVMDAIFGPERFMNEIVWCYKWGGSNSRIKFKTKHDTLLRYAGAGGEPTFNVDDVLVYGDTSGWSDASRGRIPNDWWADIPALNTQAKERTGYPTQKPLALLERIVKASSNAGDVVLDPFCGCGAALLAAAELGRNWCGIDISQKAAELTKTRLADAADEPARARDTIIMRADIPERTDIAAKPAATATEPAAAAKNAADEMYTHVK